MLYNEQKRLIEMTTEMVCRFREYVEKTGIDWMESALKECEDWATMIDSVSFLVVAFGVASLGFSFLHYRLQRENGAINYGAE